MAAVKYFSDYDGSEELVSIWPMRNAEFASTFSGFKALRYDGFSMIVGKAADGRILPASRKISFKSRPSLHKCNAKCLNGSRNGDCECSCQGKNHGAGMFTSLVSN